MAKIKDIIPNLDALKKRLDETFALGVTDFLVNTKQQRVVVVKNSRYVFVSVLIFIIVVLLLFLVSQTMTGWFLNMLIVLLFAITIFTIIISHHLYKQYKILTQQINIALIPTITACLDRIILYTHNEKHREETLKKLKGSELITDRVDIVDSDDMYSVYEPYPILVRELVVKRKESDGKNTRIRTMFHGVFLEVQFNRTFSGVTFISTEGDKYGFGHRDFWSRLIGVNNIKETRLEWNEFDRDLHVATNNPVEAREILTTNFMVDLHEWWLEHKQNIRIVFRENKMFMLLPDTDIKISTSTTSTDSEKLKKYTMTILRPLWRILNLVEDVRL